MRLNGLGYDGRVLEKRRLAERVELHLAGQHDQKSHGNWARGGSVEGDVEEGVGDFSDNFGGVFDNEGHMEREEVRVAGQLALSAIDQVHGIEKDWPQALMKLEGPNGEWLGSDEGTLGAYAPPEAGGGLDRGRLIIKAVGDRGSIASTMIHEFGHHLTLGRGVEAFHEEIARGGALADLIDAIEGTEIVGQLRTINERAHAAGPSGADAAGYTDYLLMREELVARAYYQYVALKTRHEPLMRNLNRVLTDENEGVMQWGPEEFEPVMGAMEEYLRSRGLLRE